MFEPDEQRVRKLREAQGDSKFRPEPLKAVNHMVHHGRIDLLMHPLTQRYLLMKWQAYGRFCHLFSLLLYTIFVVLVTINAMNLMMLVQRCPILLDENGSVKLFKLPPANGDAPEASPREGADGESISYCQQSTHEAFISDETTIWCRMIMVAVIVFGILNLVKKMIQMWNQSWNFVTDFENYLELAMYVSALISVTPVFHPLVTHCHIITAAITVFLAWFNMLLYFRSFESVGIYVVMFVEIQKTLLRVLVIFSVLIIAFGLSFYILMSYGNHPEFSSVPISLARTFNMMLGEIDFLTVYVYPWLASPANGTTPTPTGGGGRRSGLTAPVSLSGNGTSAPLTPGGLGQRFLPFANTSFFLVIAFMVMMPILLMNLLVGLAVGDIEAVRKNAALKRLAMQVDLHTGLERKLPQAFLDRLKQTEVIEYPNTRLCSRNSSTASAKRVLQFILYLITPSHGQQMKTFDYLEHAAICEQNEQQRQMDKLKRRLKDTARIVDATHKLMRQVTAKLEISLEAEDEDEGGQSESHPQRLSSGGRASSAAGGLTPSNSLTLRRPSPRPSPSGSLGYLP